MGKVHLPVDGLPLRKEVIKTRTRSNGTRYGAVGGDRRTPSVICSWPVAERLAVSIGCDYEKAQQILLSLGQIGMDMLLMGEPVGIPYIGVINIREVRKTYNPKLVHAMLAARGLSAAKYHIGTKVVRYKTRKLYFTATPDVRKHISDSAIYQGDLNTHVRRIRRKLAKANSG